MTLIILNAVTTEWEAGHEAIKAHFWLINRDFLEANDVAFGVVEVDKLIDLFLSLILFFQLGGLADRVRCD